MKGHTHHPTAAIAAGARLGKDNEIGPFVVIEDDVVIGDGNRFMAHSVIKSGTRIGSGNVVHEHAVLGGVPQDLGFPGHASYVRIGDRNVFREGVTIHRAAKADASTVIGDDNFLMANVHVAHDCQLGDRIVMATGAMLAGVVTVEDRAFISGGVAIHQFARVGRFAMIGGNAKVMRDALPFVITDGVPARARGLNLVGLKRAGIGVEEIRQLKEAYRILLRSGLTLQVALARLQEMDSPHVAHLVAFVEQSKRSFQRE